jgi:hypothetical protein
MSISDFYGSSMQPTKRWTGGFTEVSGPQVGQTPPEALRVDPFLPGQFADPYDPAGTIVIPAGRFVSIGQSAASADASYTSTGGVASVNTSRMGQAARGLTMLTLHDGRNLTPVGLSTNNIFKSTAQYSTGNPTAGGEFWQTGNTFGTDSAQSASDVKFRRGFLAAAPFVLSVNNAQGALVSGDSLTGFWGSTTSTSAIGWIHRGKPVKRQEKTVRFQLFSAGTTVTLTEAIYPGIEPRAIALRNTTTVVTGSTTFAFNGTNWVATLPATSTEIFYEYGQAEEQHGGEVVRIQSLADVKSREELFKFVEVARGDYLNYPPMSQKVAVVTRNQEAASVVTANRVYRILNAPLSINHAVVVEMQGTVLDPSTGILATYSSDNWFTLPSGPQLSLVVALNGPYHNINWRTGTIEFAANVATITAVRVTYSSIANDRTGAVLWGAGIEGLTDGRYLTAGAGSAGQLVPSSRTGIPAHLNFADVVGEMRFLVKN